jgi:hypothetical protein
MVGHLSLSPSRSEVVTHLSTRVCADDDDDEEDVLDWMFDGRV